MKTARTSSYIRDERVIINGSTHPVDPDHFVQRVSHLPMVALTLSRLTEVYQKTKLQNALLKLALEKGEETLLTSMTLAANIANKTGLQGPLDMADSSACYFLTKVEEKLPIITYTPDEIVYSTRRMYDDAVRPKIDRLTDMKENAVRKYNDAKQFGADKLEEVKNVGTTTVKSVVDVPVTKVNQSVEWSLNTADALVDKLLPEDEGARYGDRDVYSGNVDHAKLLAFKLRQRITARIAENTHTASLLAQTLQVIESLKSTSAAASLNHVLDNLRGLSTNNPSRNGHPHHAHHVGNGFGNGDVSDKDDVKVKALGLVRGLSGQLVEGMVSLGKMMPLPVTERMEKMVDMAKDVYKQVSEAHTIDELPQSFVSQVHNYVHSLHVTMNSALDVLTDTYLLKWLVPEYSNIGSLDIHIQ